MYFVMAQDDRVNCLNCTVLFNELTKSKIPAELHLFTTGGHGYGLRPTAEAVVQWPVRASDWMRERGFLMDLTKVETVE